MRGSAKLEGVEHATEPRFYIIIVIAKNIEDFIHDFGIVITNGTGTDFVTIHDHIVLIGDEGQFGLVCGGVFKG